MSDQTITGSCLCQEVVYEITGKPRIFQYCHCSRCRKFTGSAFGANLITSPAKFRWLKGESLVGTFQLEGAKYFATAFCKNCGSSLPWLVQTGKAIVVPAGTLDEDPNVQPTQNIFCASKAAWYKAPDSILQHDEMPPRKK